ncbi:MAG: putative signal transduction histidine kinase, partial [Acidimicrobiales bacterium]|nr:putative signal transduction histidine kinase [Acidimicrobiales bacterium]
RPWDASGSAAAVAAWDHARPHVASAVMDHIGAKQLRRLLDAVMSIGTDLDLNVVLYRIIEATAELVDAAYGALGVLDPSGSYLTDFITVGLDEAQRERIGSLPKGHGILGLLIVDPRPIRLPDLTEHPDSFGFPPNHPPMQSFLGVPLFVRGEVYGNLYLTDKRNGEVFTDIDQELAMGLAAAAGIAIENTRLHQRVREVDLLEDRERIARDLHDTVIQRLFATGLALQGAVRLTRVPEVAERIQSAVDELDVTVRQVRSAIFELHAHQAPAGLRREIIDVGDELVDGLGFQPTIRFDGPVDSAVDDEVTAHAVAVVREALTNVARHAGAGRAEVLVEARQGWLRITVDDTGTGPGARRPDGRGVSNIEARAAELGGTATIEAREGGGTRVRWEVPLPT